MPDTATIAPSLAETVARFRNDVRAMQLVVDTLASIGDSCEAPVAIQAREALARIGNIIPTILGAIVEPSDAMLAAAVALPVTEQVNNMIAVTAMRYGGGTGLPLPPNSPIQQWYRAMIVELRKEIENG